MSPLCKISLSAPLDPPAYCGYFISSIFSTEMLRWGTFVQTDSFVFINSQRTPGHVTLMWIITNLQPQYDLVKNPVGLVCELLYKVLIMKLKDFHRD